MTDKQIAVDSWVDVAGPLCSLPTTQKPLRLAEFDALFTTETTSVDRLTSTEAKFILRPEPGVAGRAAELSVREAQCCSFFDFTLTVPATQLALLVRVSEAHVGVLDALVDRAQTSAAPLGS